MSKFQIVRRHSNAGLLWLTVFVYVVLLGYFGWQTILFTSIIFPDADVQVKILTFFSVDGMGFIWANLHTFYRFAHPHAKTAVRWGWGVTYGLSALLSALYLIFTFILQWSHILDMTVIKIGIALSIGALFFNLAMLSVFLFYEISTRYAHEDDYELVDSPKKVLDPVHSKNGRSPAPF